VPENVFFASYILYIDGNLGIYQRYIAQIETNFPKGIIKIRDIRIYQSLKFNLKEVL